MQQLMSPLPSLTCSNCHDVQANASRFGLELASFKRGQQPLGGRVPRACSCHIVVNIFKSRAKWQMADLTEDMKKGS